MPDTDLARILKHVTVEWEEKGFAYRLFRHSSGHFLRQRHWLDVDEMHPDAEWGIDDLVTDHEAECLVIRAAMEWLVARDYSVPDYLYSQVPLIEFVADAVEAVAGDTNPNPKET